MIDISTLLDIDIDTAGNTVTVGGGVNIGEIMAALQAVGKETREYSKHSYLTGICIALLEASY